MISGKVVSAGQQSKSNPPAPSPDAPRGWTWDENKGSWRPSGTRGKKGRNPWEGQAAEDQPAAAGPPPADSFTPDDRDPDPGWQREEQKPKRRQSIKDVPKETQDNFASLAGLVATPVLSLLVQMDPYCGSVLRDCFGNVLDATLPIIFRSEKMAEFFSGDKDGWLQWAGLAMALAPVAQAIAAHHVFHTVEVVRQPDGQIQVMRVQPGGDQGSHVTPPTQGEYDPSAYAA